MRTFKAWCVFPKIWRGKFATPFFQFGLLRWNFFSPCLFRAASRPFHEALSAYDQKLQPAGGLGASLEGDVQESQRPWCEDSDECPEVAMGPRALGWGCLKVAGLCCAWLLGWALLPWETQSWRAPAPSEPQLFRQWIRSHLPTSYFISLIHIQVKSQFHRFQIADATLKTINIYKTWVFSAISVGNKICPTYFTGLYWVS